MENRKPSAEGFEDDDTVEMCICICTSAIEEYKEQGKIVLLESRLAPKQGDSHSTAEMDHQKAVSIGHEDSRKKRDISSERSTYQPRTNVSED